MSRQNGSHERNSWESPKFWDFSKSHCGALKSGPRVMRIRGWVVLQDWRLPSSMLIGSCYLFEPRHHRSRWPPLGFQESWFIKRPSECLLPQLLPFLSHEFSITAPPCFPGSLSVNSWIPASTPIVTSVLTNAIMGRDGARLSQQQDR